MAATGNGLSWDFEIIRHASREQISPYGFEENGKKNYFQVALRYNSSLGRRGKKVTETFYQISEKSTNSRVSADPAMCPSLGLFLCRTSHEVAGKERATYTEQFTAKWFVTHWSW